MCRQRHFESRRIPFVGFALGCLLSGALVASANPEPVAVRVTFVDPVAIRAANALEYGSLYEDPSKLILTDTARQARTILVHSADGHFDVTVSYK